MRWPQLTEISMVLLNSLAVWQPTGPFFLTLEVEALGVDGPEFSEFWISVFGQALWYHVGVPACPCGKRLVFVSQNFSRHLNHQHVFLGFVHKNYRISMFEKSFFLGWRIRGSLTLRHTYLQKGFPAGMLGTSMEFPKLGSGEDKKTSCPVIITTCLCISLSTFRKGIMKNEFATGKTAIHDLQVGDSETDW